MSIPNEGRAGKSGNRRPSTLTMFHSYSVTSEPDLMSIWTQPPEAILPLGPRNFGSLRLNLEASQIGTPIETENSKLSDRFHAGCDTATCNQLNIYVGSIDLVYHFPRIMRLALTKPGNDRQPGRDDGFSRPRRRSLPEEQDLRDRAADPLRSCDQTERRPTCRPQSCPCSV